MGSILHGNATTTPRIRKEIQDAQESLATLAERYYINEKTVLHWKHADGVEDKKSGPKFRKSVLNELEQQVICTVRRHLRLPLDDLLIVFKPLIPALTRSNLHRCLQHYGLSRLPKDELSMEKKPFKQYNIGYVHVDITELHGETGKWYLFVAIDRLTKYVYVELHQGMTEGNAVDFLRNLQAECVFKITHILTDNGAQFTYKLLPEKDRPRPNTRLTHSVRFLELSTEPQKSAIRGQTVKWKLPTKSSSRRPRSFIMPILKNLKCI